MIIHHSQNSTSLGIGRVAGKVVEARVEGLKPELKELGLEFGKALAEAGIMIASEEIAKRAAAWIEERLGGAYKYIVTRHILTILIPAIALQILVAVREGAFQNLIVKIIRRVWKGIRDEDISKISELIIVGKGGKAGLEEARKEGKILKLTNWETGEKTEGYLSAIRREKQWKLRLYIKDRSRKVVGGKVFKINGRLYLALEMEGRRIRFIDVEGRSEVPIPPFKELRVKLEIKGVVLDIILEHVGKFKYKVKGLRLFEGGRQVRCDALELLAAKKAKEPVGWVELTEGSIVSVDRGARNIYIRSKEGRIMAIRHTEFFDILRDYEPITTLESITVYGSGASTFKLPRGDLEIEVKSTYIRVRARGGRKILRIIKDLKSVEHVKELFSDAVKNLGKDWIVIEILGELRRAESGEENYAIGTIRELYAFLKKRLILPWKEKPKGRIVIKYTFSRRPGFDFLKYEEGEIIVVEVKGGRPEALDRLMNEANKRVARKFKDLKDMLKNLGLKELKIRLERVGEVELVVEGEKGKILLRVKGYVYKIVGSPFKEGAEAHGFEEGRYLISLEKLPEGREIKVNLDKAYLEAVLEYLREGKIEIKTVEFKPKVEKRGKLVWEENVISVFPIQL